MQITLNVPLSIGSFQVSSAELIPCVFVEGGRPDTVLSDYGMILCSLAPRYGRKYYVVQVNADITHSSCIIVLLDERRVIPLVRKFLYVGHDDLNPIGTAVYAWRCHAAGLSKLYHEDRNACFNMLTAGGVEMISGCDLVLIK